MKAKKKKGQRRSAPAGGKGKAGKVSQEGECQKTAPDNRTSPKDPAMPERDSPSQVSEAVIGLAECPHRVKSSSDRSLPPQQPAQSSPLDSIFTEPVQIARINIEISLMSDQSSGPGQQQKGPASEEPKSRSDAVTLLRARTASRSSLVESSDPFDSPRSGASSLTGDDTQSVTASHTSLATTESTAEPSKGKKKKNKSKSKKKYKKLDLATVAPDSSPHPHRRSSHTESDQSTAQLAESQLQKGGNLENTESSSAQSKSNHKVGSSSCTNESKIVDYSAAVKGYSFHEKHVPQAEKNTETKTAQAEIEKKSEDISETRSLLTSTPKSSTTIWSTLGPQVTPQSERSATESDEAAHRRQGSSGKQKATSSGQNKSSHTHPESPARSERSTLTAPSTQGGVSRQKPQGFFWQLDSHGFPCAKSGCDKRCNLWDGATVICPRCGPYSELRYCSKDHLLEDIKWHWLYCGQMTFEHPCRDSSIPRQVREGPPMIPCIHPYDTPERHRQAVRFSMDARAGDYFIFSDWQDFVAAGFPEDRLDVRCPHRVVHAVKFDDPEEKDRFRRVLAACLFLTIDVHELVDYLFRLIRDKLRAEGVTQGLEVLVKYQFQSEFNVTIQEGITGARHACETDWNGRNRRNCPDATCRAEFRRLLGSPPGRGHSQLIDHLEGNYWILRTARTTHPVISGIKARMRGDGFDQVADEDRRVFRRGEGWDGAGTGEMEIEDVNA